LNIERDTVLKYHKSSEESFFTDNSLIKRQQGLGHRLWNAPSLFLDSISFENGQVLLHVKSCCYYAVATNLIRLQDETAHAVKQWSFEQCNLRKKYYLELENAHENLLRPMPIGCLVVFAMKTVDGYEIIMQTRSEHNIISNNVPSVVPDFGLKPFVGLPDHTPERRSLLYYNFIKEYLEELHDMNDLINEFKLNKPVEQFYEWLYNQTAAKKLWDNDNFHLYYLGFGFNLMSGIPNIGLLAKLDSESDALTIKNSIMTNWEIAKPNPINKYKPTIWYLNATTQISKIEQLFIEKQLHPNVSFFLSKALKHLN
jgi:hypothetical protein